MYHSKLSYRTICRQRSLAVRRLATETIPSSTGDVPPIPRPSSVKPRTRLYPHPRRPAASHGHSRLPSLPPSFGRNQLLPVSKSTRALLESVVAEFKSPIRYAFAYGSGVFEQDGYPVGNDVPMIDFMFAVTHSAHWHSINMQQHPGHYPIHARLLGSSYVSKIEEISPGVWFNAYVPIKGVVRACCLPRVFFSDRGMSFRLSNTV
jgi:mitochondrial translocator assembly and maintenance protein 41